MTITKADIGAYLQTLRAFADAVRDAGVLGIGAGSLYAVVMDRMSLQTFDNMIGKLVDAGLVHRAPSGLLTWTGPAK